MWSRPRFSVVLAALTAMSHATSLAPADAGEWQAKRIAKPTVPAAIVPELRAKAAGGLPDGLVATYQGQGDVAAAWYAKPTSRYAHAILGDGIEAGELKVKLADGRVVAHSLAQSDVFEDRYPRLADLDGDGRVEIITIRSSLSQGGSVAVFGIAAGAIVLRAASNYIGRSNRWLNIAGIADFLGDGSKQIAYVETPHIGGTLYLYALRQGRLVRVARKYGFSNHAIGAREMRLSAVADVNDDGRVDLALPSANRKALRIVSITDRTIQELAAVSLPAQIDRAIKWVDEADRKAFIVGLANGAVYEVRRR